MERALGGEWVTILHCERHDAMIRIFLHLQGLKNIYVKG